MCVCVRAFVCVRVCVCGCLCDNNLFVNARAENKTRRTHCLKYTCWRRFTQAQANSHLAAILVVMSPLPMRPYSMFSMHWSWSLNGCVSLICIVRATHECGFTATAPNTSFRLTIVHILSLSRTCAITHALAHIQQANFSVRGLLESRVGQHCEKLRIACVFA